MPQILVNTARAPAHTFSHDSCDDSDLDVPGDDHESSEDVEMEDSFTNREPRGNIDDRRSGSDVLQRLYDVLRNFGGKTRGEDVRRPWHSAWHTVLDLLFRLMGISERMMDLFISCLHWLADVGEILTHERLPKNVHQLKYWHKTCFPDMSEFVGLCFGARRKCACNCVLQRESK